MALLLLAKGDVVLHSRHVPRVLLRCLPLQGLVVVRAPWLGWILPLFQRLEECRDCVALRGEKSCDPPPPPPPPCACRVSRGRCICLVSCSNSPIRRWLTRQSASTSFVFAYIASNVSGGLLPASPGGSCILGGLALLLLVFRVDTISN